MDKSEWNSASRRQYSDVVYMRAIVSCPQRRQVLKMTKNCRFGREISLCSDSSLCLQQSFGQWVRSWTGIIAHLFVATLWGFRNPALHRQTRHPSHCLCSAHLCFIRVISAPHVRMFSKTKKKTKKDFCLCHMLVIFVEWWILELISLLGTIVRFGILLCK